MQRSVRSRLDALEAGLDALSRAYLLLQRGIPPEQWPDAGLNAFCDERPEMGRLSDAQLEELCAAAPGQVERILAEMLAELPLEGQTNGA